MSRDTPASTAVRLDALTRVMRLGGGLQTDVWLLAGDSAPGWPTRLAVKTLKPDFQTERAKAALRAEIDAHRKLTHHGCVPCLGEARLGDSPALAMPLVDGVTLTQLRHVAASLPVCVNGPAAVLSLLATDLLQVLTWLHCHPAGGRIHGDIKPGNIWLGVNGRARLGDFGSLAFFGQAREADTPLNATPRYCRPQRLDGAPVDICDDYFALGMSLLTILCGASGNLQECARLVTRLPAPVQSLAAHLLVACDAALGDDDDQARDQLAQVTPSGVDWAVRCEVSGLVYRIFRAAY